MIYQNVKTIRSGLSCKVRVANHSGDDILTTYDDKVDNSVEIAQADLAAFFQSCIDEFEAKCPGLRPSAFGRQVGQSEFILVNPVGDDFDLKLYDEILVQPVPLAGG